MVEPTVFSLSYFLYFLFKLPFYISISHCFGRTWHNVGLIWADVSDV